MNPDVAVAIPLLVESGALPAEPAPQLLRVARGQLLSVRAALRAVLYASVLVLAGGVGLMVQQNLERIGPVAIAAAVGLAAVAALAWVMRAAPPFAWHEVASPNLAFDYILLLGILLGAADLAYCEVEFGWLGIHASWHLLIVSMLAGLAAFRFDSRVVFSLALSTFAAWRGVALGHAGSALWSAAGAVRWNVMACGVLFAALGWGLARGRRKAHFEPVAVHLGWLLILAGLASGMGESSDRWLAWTGALLLVGGGLAVAAFRARRFPLFAYGVIAAYVGLTRLLAAVSHDVPLGCLWIGGSSLGIIAGLLAAQRRMKGAV